MRRTTCSMYFVLDGTSLHCVIRSGVTFRRRYTTQFNRVFLQMRRR